MFKNHFDTVENALVAISKVPANTGHPLHKGTPRENFIKKFLKEHLPANVTIGTGEIIDSQSRPTQARNQHDIVIYRTNFPRLDFGGVHGFLAESVYATIEVKSTLDKRGLEQAVRAAVNCKELKISRSALLSVGYSPPAIANYVIAYGGPSNIETILGWLHDIYVEIKVVQDDLPQDLGTRVATASKSLDGIFILNNGFVYFDNVIAGFATPELRLKCPKLKWVYRQSETGNLGLFFILLMNILGGSILEQVNLLPYCENFRFQGIKYTD